MVKIQNVLKQLSGKKTGRLKKRWEFNSEGMILSPPHTDVSETGEQVILFGNSQGKVFLLGKDAKIKWVYEIEETLDEIQKLFTEHTTRKSVTTRPVYRDINLDGKNEVLVGANNGKLYAIRHDGTLLWDFVAKGAIRSTPALVEIKGSKPLIVFGSDDSNLYCLDSDGRLVWKFQASSGIQSPPAVRGSKITDAMIVFGSNDGTVHALSPKGRVLWKFKTKGQVIAPPVFGDINNDGRPEVLIGSLDNCLYALSDKGKLLWKFRTEGSIKGGVALADLNGDGFPEIVFGSCDHRVYCLTHNGNKLWDFATNFWVIDTPVITDIDHDKKPEIVVGSYDASLYILDAHGTFLLNYTPGVSQVTLQSGHFSDDITTDPGQYVGKKIWEYKLGDLIIGSSVAKDSGDIVVSTKDGKLSVISHQKE